MKAILTTVFAALALLGTTRPAAAQLQTVPPYFSFEDFDEAEFEGYVGNSAYHTWTGCYFDVWFDLDDTPVGDYVHYYKVRVDFRWKFSSNFYSSTNTATIYSAQQPWTTGGSYEVSGNCIPTGSEFDFTERESGATYGVFMTLYVYNGFPASWQSLGNEFFVGDIVIH